MATTIFNPKLISKRPVQRLVRKWIRALRSGGYHQAQEELRAKPYWDAEKEKEINKYGYCCLGVACDIIDHKGWKKSGHPLGMYDGPDIPGPIEDRSGVLGKEGLEMFGLRKAANIRLVHMNDRGDSFKQIADFLKGELAKATGS